MSAPHTTDDGPDRTLTLRHILVATDLDDASEPIYAWALVLARALDADVTLVHVDQLGPLGFHDSGSLNRWLDHFQEVLTLRIERVAAMIESEGIRCQAVIRQGHPAEQILSTIVTEAADLLVIARRREGPLSRLLVGSTTRKLLRRAPIPVLVVDIKHATNGVAIQRVVSTTDLSEDSDLGLEVAKALSEALEATLDVVHVFQWPLYVPHAPGHPTTTLPPTALEELRRFYETELEASRAVADQSGYHVTVDPDVANGILTMAARRHADLLIIPSHGKGTLEAAVLGSTSEKVVEAAEVPVLVLPRAWLAALEGAEEA